MKEESKKPSEKMPAKKSEIDFDFSCTGEIVTPLRDHVIKQNDFQYELKKSEPIRINKLFIQTLKIEKVI